MGDINFTPSFKDIVEYVDDQDRVQADGPKGFNGRFSAIESDLAQLSTVVAAIDGKLDQLEVTPPPTAHRLTLPLRIVGGDGNWNNGLTGVAEVSPGERASGTMNLVPPDGVQLLTFRAVGQAVGITIHITMLRQPLGGGQVDTLATINGDANPFDVSKDIAASVGTVNTSGFHYWISASCDKTAPDTVTAVISALQLTFSA